jgi:RNA polymerase sigma-70 factor, ECF subfamily
MGTTVIVPNSFTPAWVERPKPSDDRACSEMVNTFGGRVFSIAKQITQNDADAEDVLIETFLEVCPDLDRCSEYEDLWLRFVAVTVRGALSKLRARGQDLPLFDQVAFASEDLVIREFSPWGDHDQQHGCPERTTRLLEHGLRSLDPLSRAVFVLWDIEEIPAEHVAEIVNRSAEVVKVYLLRARLQLREILARKMGQQQ